MIVDLLPTDHKVLGFGSRWYPLIVAIVDGRPELAEELAAAPVELQDWVRTEIDAMATKRGFLDSLPGMVPGHGDVVGRVDLLRTRFAALARGGRGMTG